jgi:hypothetical protein
MHFNFMKSALEKLRLFKIEVLHTELCPLILTKQQGLAYKFELYAFPRITTVSVERTRHETVRGHFLHGCETQRTTASRIQI